MPPARPWRSPSEIAEFVYCPRAHYYQGSSVDPGPDPRLDSGLRYHRRELAGERRRARHPVALWLLAAAGAGLLAAAVLAGLGGSVP